MGLYKNKLTKHRSFQHQQDGKQECSRSGDEALRMDGADHDRTTLASGDVLEVKASGISTKLPERYEV